MDVQKIREAIVTYRKYFEKLGVPKGDFQRDKNPSFFEAYMHCHGMLDKMERFLEEGRIDKVQRWLGFIQGVLWATSAFGLEELKAHNRPATAESISGEEVQKEAPRKAAAFHLI